MLKSPFPWFMVDNNATTAKAAAVNSKTVERFWSKVDKRPSCWLWTASRRHKGYGAFVWALPSGEIIQGRAHRFSWIIHNGEIPDCLCVLHKCDNPLCVNPDHLFLGTKAENNADMLSKGRHVKGGSKLKSLGLLGNYERGERHHAAKLNPSLVRRIRAEKSRMSYSKLSAKYGVSVGNLHRIVTGKAWSHVI